MKSKASEQQKLQIMASTVKPIIDLLHKRMKNRIDTLNTLTNVTLDNVPETVKLKREEEASKLRAVIQEQSDLIEIIESLYPTG